MKFINKLESECLLAKNEPIKDSLPNGSEYILSALTQEGINYFFMVPGKLINPIMSCYSLINKNEKKFIQPIVAAHEGGAAYMAEGYARASGKFGVCITIGGPGTTNAVTAITSAYMDNFPVMIISGQIPSAFEMMGTLQDSTQTGFNLTDVMKPITAVAHEIRNSYLIDRYFTNAIKNMLSYESRPVYLSITKDALLGKVNEVYKKIDECLLKPKFLDLARAKHIVDNVLKKTSKICFLVGSRAKTEEVSNLLITLSNKYHIPVATTLSAKGSFPEDHRYALGVFGYSGNKRAIDTILSDEVETLIMIGFDATQWNTLAWHDQIQPSHSLVQVDRHSCTIGRHLPVEYPLLSDEAEFLKFLLVHGDESFSQTIKQRQSWLKVIDTISFHYDTENLNSIAVPLHPVRVIKELRNYFPRNTMVLVDSGAHRSFMGHYWKAYSPFDYLSATTLGPMGWAIPASIGAKLARPDMPCLVVTGDGCMLMHGVEIQTASKYKLPIIYIVMNNAYYSASYFNNKNNRADLTQLPLHNWAKFAHALGVDATIVEFPEDIAPAIQKAYESNCTYLIDVRCGHEYITPVLEYTKRLKELGGV